MLGTRSHAREELSSSLQSMNIALDTGLVACTLPLEAVLKRALSDYTISLAEQASSAKQDATHGLHLPSIAVEGY